MKVNSTKLYRPSPISLLLTVVIGKSYSQIKKFEKVIVSSLYQNIDDFSDFAQKAKKAGATHVDVGTSLPASRWEYIQDNDPYPGWTVNNASLLKIATPKALQPYIPQDYTNKTLVVLDQRCKILRSLGLKAYICTEVRHAPRSSVQGPPTMEMAKSRPPFSLACSALFTCSGQPRGLSIVSRSCHTIAYQMS